MDFRFFDALTHEGAIAYLNRFLEIEGRAFTMMAEQVVYRDLEMDFSLPSISRLMKGIYGQLKARSVPIPESEPTWIRRAHQGGLIEFDDESNVLIMRAGYYFGESFVRASDGLVWGIGRSSTAERNMPVVKTFKHDLELAPVLVAENLFLRVARGSPLIDIDDAVTAWRAAMP